MRTTYISQDSDAVRKPGYNEKTAKAMREVSDRGGENKLRLSSDPSQIYGVTSHSSWKWHLSLTLRPHTTPRARPCFLYR